MKKVVFLIAMCALSAFAYTHISSQQVTEKPILAIPNTKTIYCNAVCTTNATIILKYIRMVPRTNVIGTVTVGADGIGTANATAVTFERGDYVLAETTSTNKWSAQIIISD